MTKNANTISAEKDYEMLNELYGEYTWCFEWQKLAKAASGDKERQRVYGLCSFLRIAAGEKATMLWGTHQDALQSSSYPSTYSAFHNTENSFDLNDFSMGITGAIVWDMWNELINNRKTHHAKKILERLGNDCYSILVLVDAKKEITRIHEPENFDHQSFSDFAQFSFILMEVQLRRIHWGNHFKKYATFSK